MRRITTTRRGAAFAAAICETLEARQLLTAFQFFVDNKSVDPRDPVQRVVDYGNVALGAVERHTFVFKYLGNSSVELSDDLTNSGFTRSSGDDSGKQLAKNETYTVTYEILANRPTTRANDLVFFFTESGGEQETRSFALKGTVLPSSVGAIDNFGALTNAVRTPSGTISARYREDGEGNTLEEVSPYICAFELTAAATRVDLKLTGTSLNAPSPFNGKTSGELSVLMAKDSNGDGRLSIAEREAALKTVNSGNIAEGGSASRSGNGTWGAGKYLALVKAIDMRPANTPVPSELGFALVLTVDDVAAPAFEVRGNNVVINNNDSTPSESDGTSFGNINEGQQAALTFSVKNTGEATMNIDGQRPNVTGDFVIVEGLNSTVAAGGSDTFQVRLTNTTPGQKSGTITIQSSNASGGNFTFNVGGTVNGIAPPPPPFAVKSGTTLTVTGTNGNDTLTSTVGGGNFKFALNGVESASFATSSVTKIVINLLDGNDNYSSATQLDIKQTINGGNGNDFLRGGKQADGLFGNEGDDRMDGRTRGDLHDGGAGSDTAIYRQRRATEPVTVTIDETANDGGSSDQSKDNVLSSTEHIQGGLGDDNLTGSSKTNRLFGFEGNDTLNGLKGNDTLDGGAGENQINGGFGNDSIFSRNTIGDVIDGGADTDSLVGDLLDDVQNVENEDRA